MLRLASQPWPGTPTVDPLLSALNTPQSEFGSVGRRGGGPCAATMFLICLPTGFPESQPASRWTVPSSAAPHVHLPGVRGPLRCSPEADGYSLSYLVLLPLACGRSHLDAGLCQEQGFLPCCP